MLAVYTQLILLETLYYWSMYRHSNRSWVTNHMQQIPIAVSSANQITLLP